MTSKEVNTNNIIVKNLEFDDYTPINKRTYYNSEGELEQGAIQKFIGKLKNWKFNPPSNNLWTVEILLHNDGTSSKGKHTLSALYSNICAVNKNYNDQISGYWDVKSPNGSNASEYEKMVTEFSESYIEELSGSNDIGLFLAQGVKYQTHKAQINSNIADQLSPYAGFMTWGMSTVGKTAAQEANIQFLETNWNIGNILFDKWIAAVLQQGLVEDDSLPNIKSDIIIKKYSPSIPANMMGSKASDEFYKWQLKETVTLYKAVPLSHEGDDQLTYELPTPKPVTVNFNYVDYSIKYHVGSYLK